MIEILGGRVDLDENTVIKEYYTELGNVKILYHKDARHSITFVDEEKRNDICDQYFAFYDLPVCLNPEGKNYLVLGGGGFTYPKYYISKYYDKRMDVVEINEKCVEWAKEYFYLDELIEDYDDKKERLNIIIDDAIKYINTCNKKYDYILIDLFDGVLPVDEIYEGNNINNLKRLLNENGIIVINYVISNGNIYKYKEVLRKIVKLTKNYKIITNKYYFNTTNNMGNVLIMLSDNEINLSNKYSYMGINYIID